MRETLRAVGLRRPGVGAVGSATDASRPEPLPSDDMAYRA
jgi:hypothetical protein